MFVIKGVLKILGDPAGIFAVDDKDLLVLGMGACPGEVGEVSATGGDHRIGALRAGSGGNVVTGLLLAVDPQLVTGEAGLGEEEVLAVIADELQTDVGVACTARNARDRADGTGGRE